jgi:hypothetical protein
MSSVAELAVTRASEIAPRAAEEEWLVESLWGKSAVGIVGGAPKVMKTWFGLEMAVSVASDTPCLGRFPVRSPGPALVFLAEDALPSVRERIEGLCGQRGRRIEDLDLLVITEPVLRLDDPRCRERLERTVQRHAPRLLLLDPLVRLHRCDENSSQEISGLLSHLRELQRRHGVSVVLVHHASKRRRAHPGQSLRGSSDLHAWTDSTAILERKREHVLLSLEHRFAPAPNPLVLGLTVGERGDTGLRILDDVPVVLQSGPDGLASAVLATLRSAGRPLLRKEIRERVRANNQRLGDTLSKLEASGRLRRSREGWTAVGGNGKAREEGDREHSTKVGITPPP